MSAEPIDPASHEAIRQVAKADLYFLARRLLGYQDLTPGFHLPLCQRIETTPYRKNLWLLPRDFFKTSIITVARSIQLFLRDPNIRILIASNKAENAEAMLREIKGHLINPILQALFPEILWMDPAHQAEQWTTGAITVKRTRRAKEGTIETVGAEGELTSKHYDYMIFDDVVGLENSQTRDQLLRTIRWWQTAQGLTEPHTKQDIVGTPWHYADLYAWLKEQRDKQGMELGFYRRPAWELDEHGRRIPAFPERWSLKRLDEEKLVQGTAVFASQRLLDPIDEETAVFPRRQAIVRDRQTFPPLDQLWLCMTVDPAISTKAWADYSAIAVGGFARDDTLYLLGLKRGRWTESSLIREIYALWEAFPGIRVIGFEMVGFAKIYRRVLASEGEQRGVQLPVLALERDTRITKNVRIRALQPRWEGGRLVLASDLPALEDFLEEAERFRLTKESTHDDMLDAVVDLEQLRRRPALSEEPAPLDTDLDWIDRRRFEREILRESPGMDRSGVRHAWSLHRRRQQQEEEREMSTFGAEADEFWP